MCWKFRCSIAIGKLLEGDRGVFYRSFDWEIYMINIKKKELVEFGFLLDLGDGIRS